MVILKTPTKTIISAFAFTCAAGAAAFAWGTLVERNLFTLRRVTVPILTPGSDPIRVLHLSDLHMAGWQRKKQDWIRGLADLQPDLIVNTGDNLGHTSGITGIGYAFERFRGIPGVFVNGSNDYFGPVPKNPFRYFFPTPRHLTPLPTLNTRGLEGFFTELGWLNLNNTAAVVDVQGTRIECMGVDDPHYEFDRLGLLAGTIDELQANDPHTEEQTLTIGVTHAPYHRVLNSFVNHGAEMIFAGHTHGGQICVPGYGALVTNCDIPRHQAKGLSHWSHGTHTAFLNVSAGLGTSIYAPIRFACPPEATLLTLTPRPYTPLSI